MSSREIAHDSDDGVEQAARSCEPTATRAFGVSAIWMDRTFCYACCPPLLTLKDNLHSRCAAISDYPSRPSSPADRWLYLLIGPLNLLGWRAPRAASGAPEAHRHTTPASALKQAPHWEPHTHMRRRREDRTLPVHTYNQRTLACKGRGGWVTRDCAQDSDDGVGASVPKLRADVGRSFGAAPVSNLDRVFWVLLAVHLSSR